MPVNPESMRPTPASFNAAVKEANTIVKAEASKIITCQNVEDMKLATNAVLFIANRLPRQR